MKEIIDYILTWLCYGDAEAAQRVAYTANERALETHDVLIVPNGKLGQEIVVPDMRKVQVDNPAKGKYIVRTDLVYAVFFFTSRAEELINPQRDEHGRFLAKYSLLCKGNRLQIPMLDEYARLMLKLLGLPMPANGFAQVSLTHDIDAISRYRHLRGAAGGILRGEGRQVWQSWLDIHRDPLYTFPWMIEQDNTVPQAQQIYFVKHTRGRGYDYPQYCLIGRDWRRLRHSLKDAGAKLGVHSSYYGSLPCHANTRLHRSHFLRCSIEQMQRIASAGFTDDYTMGFADEVGFRLQTSRPIRWINPQTMQLTSLTLHPLLVMDCTLDQYMHLTEDEAYFLCERLFEKVKMHHGELCLLWHNSAFTEESYHTSLYPKLLKLIHG